MEIKEIEPCELHETLLSLREDRGMDLLECMTGMDWGDEGLGVVYLLESTATGERMTVRTVTQEREKPVLPSVCDIWKAAELNEREVYDFFGIRFEGHPDLRRFFLSEDWAGWPLQKVGTHPGASYAQTNSNGGSKLNHRTHQDASLQGGSKDAPECVPTSETECVINIGPQHPATHGVMHFRVALDGETIQGIDVDCGYIHRGIEKMCESLTYPQTLALTDRLDYLSAHMNRHALCICIEQAAGIEVSERVKYIRTIMDELQRIDSHLLFFSCLAMDLGALTAFFYGFRDREKILDIFEETCGGRLIMNYNTIGGVQADIVPDFARKVKRLISYLRDILREYHDVFTGNVIAQQRLKGVGVLTREDAISFGATGGTGRASGWACDVRKRHPYALYDKVEFREVIRTEGDCWARYLVRMEEILESLRIIEQLIDNIPQGAYQAKVKPVVRLPEGTYYTAVEAARGEFGVWIESHGEKHPYRLHFRSTGLPLVATVDTLSRGAKIADLIAIGGTLDYVVPDIDR